MSRLLEEPRDSLRELLPDFMAFLLSEMCTGKGVLWAKFLLGVESLFDEAVTESLFKSSTFVFYGFFPGLMLVIPMLLSHEFPLL